MFTNHNIPKSLLGDVSSFWVDNKHNYNLPREFIEAAKVASIEYRKAINLEDRKNVVLAHLDETVKKTGTESNAHYMVNEFERAVAGFANDISNVEILDTDNNEETVLSEDKSTPSASRDMSSKNRNYYKSLSKAVEKAKKDSGRTTREGHGKPVEKDTIVTRNVGGKQVQATIPKGVRPVDKKDDSKEYENLPKKSETSSAAPAAKKPNLKALRAAAAERDAKKAMERSKASGGLGNPRTLTQSRYSRDHLEDPNPGDSDYVHIDGAQQDKNKLDREKANKKRLAKSMQNMKSAGGLGVKKEDVNEFDELTTYLLEMEDSQIDDFLASLDDEDAQNLQEWVDWVNTEIDKYENQMKLEEHLSSLSEEQFGELLEQLTEDQVNTLLAMLEINTECDDGPNDDEETNEQEEVERQ